MKHPGKPSIVFTFTFAAVLLVIQSVAAGDYEKFIFRPSAQKQSFLDKYFLKYFHRTLFDGSYAIVIAVGDYDVLPKLDSAMQDAAKMKNFLLNTAEYDEVVVLTDAQADSATIRYFMEEYFPQKMTEERYRFLFYFSGHGTQREGYGNTTLGYLQLKGASRKPNTQSINMRHIESWAMQLPAATHMLFLLDACFSGLAGTEGKSYETGVDPRELAEENGRFMITAGGADETSIASLSHWGGSLFTEIAISGMRGAADFNRDGVVTMYELFTYTQGAVRNEAKKVRHIQHPLISSLGGHSDKGQYFFVYQDPEPPQVEEVESPDDVVKKRDDAITLRSEAIQVSSEDALKEFKLQVVKEGDYSYWRPQNYIDNQFEARGEVVVDRTTGLIWQQSGSEDWMSYEDALKYVAELNRQKFAGYDDWRLPTMPELMSLLEPEKQSNDLYIDPVFDDTQWWCWSADLRQIKGEYSPELAWGVHFGTGEVDWDRVGGRNYVRCVRS